MEEIKRVGNSECLIYLLTPNWRFCVRDFFDDPTHVRPYSDKSLSMLLRLSGFKSIKVFRAYDASLSSIMRIHSDFKLPI